MSEKITRFETLEASFNRLQRRIELLIEHDDPRVQEFNDYMVEEAIKASQDPDMQFLQVHINNQPVQGQIPRNFGMIGHRWMDRNEVDPCWEGRDYEKLEMVRQPKDPKTRLPLNHRIYIANTYHGLYLRSEINFQDLEKVDGTHHALDILGVPKYLEDMTDQQRENLREYVLDPTGR